MYAFGRIPWLSQRALDASQTLLRRRAAARLAARAARIHTRPLASIATRRAAYAFACSLCFDVFIVKYTIEYSL